MILNINYSYNRGFAGRNQYGRNLTGCTPFPYPVGSSPVYLRATGIFQTGNAGTYTFGVNSSDGCNLYIAGTQVVAALGNSQSASADRIYTQSGTLELRANWEYEFVLEYQSSHLTPALQLLSTAPGESLAQLLSLSTLNLTIWNSGYPSQGGTLAQTPDYTYNKVAKSTIQYDSPGLYTRSFWERPPYTGLITLWQILSAGLDEFRTDAMNLPDLTDIVNCPPQFLQKLAALVDYTPPTGETLVTTTKNLRKLIRYYQIRSTPASFERFLRYLGATQDYLFYPYTEICVLDSYSPLDDNSFIPDNYMWRQGSHEVITDLALNKWLSQMMVELNPSGKILIPNVITAKPWGAATTYILGTDVLDDSDLLSGDLFQIESQGISSGSEPVWPPVGQAIYDGSDIIWRNRGTISSLIIAPIRLNNTGYYSLTGVTRGVSTLLPTTTTKAITFNGSSGYIKVPATSNNLSEKPFSVVFAIKSTASGTGKVIYYTGESSSSPGWEVYTSGGNLYFRVDDSSGNSHIVQIPGSPLNGSPHLVCVCLDSINSRILVGIDGGAFTVSAAAPVTSITPFTPSMLIGTDLTHYFSGSLQGLAYFSYVLTNDQFHDFYEQATVGVADGYESAINYANPTSYWFFGDTDAIATDLGTGLLWDGPGPNAHASSSSIPPSPPTSLTSFTLDPWRAYLAEIWYYGSSS